MPGAIFAPVNTPPWLVVAAEVSLGSLRTANWLGGSADDPGHSLACKSGSGGWLTPTGAAKDQESGRNITVHKPQNRNGTRASALVNSSIQE